MPSRRSFCLLWMTLASSCHYVGYELARIATVALFTSPRHGFAGNWAVSLATSCVSPTSLVLLSVYTRLYDAQGPRRALLVTTLAFAAVLFGGGAALSVCLEASDSDIAFGVVAPVRWGRYLLFALFAVQNAMVYLLSTQHWSFLGSVATSAVQTSWIAGVGSIVSTLAGVIGPSLSGDLTKLLLGAGIALVGSAYLGEVSYRIAEEEGFLLKDRSGSNHHQRRQTKHGDDMLSLPIIKRATRLFRRVPVLGWLCLEVFCYQSQSSLLHFLFLTSEKSSLVGDAERANYTASTFATINLCSGLLQFILLPLLVWRRVDLKPFWLGVPSTMVAAVAFMTYRRDWSLRLVSATFMLSKTLEYSLRHSMIEGLYATLDFESRFLGKEIIALFANRLGKSSVALALTVATLVSDACLPYIRMAMLVLCSTWWMASYRLIQVLDAQGAKPKSD